MAAEPPPQETAESSYDYQVTTSSPLVTFVVPTRNSRHTILSCLTSIRVQRGCNLEIIVVDNGSTDGTVELAEKVADIVASGGPERSAQRNKGAALASGDYLVFLDSDMELSDSVAKQVVIGFTGSPALGALVIPERSFGTGFWSQCRALEKQLYVGDTAMEAARAFPRSVFASVGGYDESLTGVEDWELPQRVHSCGWQIGRIKAFVEHKEGTTTLRGSFSKKRYYGRSASAFVLRPGALRRGRLLRLSLLKPNIFLKHRSVAMGLLCLKVVDFAGFALGAFEAIIRTTPRHRLYIDDRSATAPDNHPSEPGLP